MTSAELLVDADLRARAQARFAEGMGGQPYQSPVPADQPPPLPKDDSRASGS